MSVASIHPKSLAELDKSGKKPDLIDVRTPVEFREVHVEAARKCPLDRLDPVAVMQARNGSATSRCTSSVAPGAGAGRRARSSWLQASRTSSTSRAARWPASRAACQSSGARRRSRWSGRSALRRDCWCCSAPCSAGSSTRLSSACRRSSGPGWCSPASPIPAAWA